MPVEHAIVIGTPKTGTKYIVDLFKENGYPGVVHEAAYLDYQACQVRQGNLPDALTGPITAPHRNDDVWLEANNTLSWFLPILQDRHPDLRIIYLHRNGAHIVRSLMSGAGLNAQTGWDKTPELVPPCKDWDAPHFIKACHAWADLNQHVLQHLDTERSLILPSQALWNGAHVETIEAFLDVTLDTPQIEAVDQRDTHTFPEFNRWPRPYKVTFWAYCADVMNILNYVGDDPPLTHAPNPDPGTSPSPEPGSQPPRSSAPGTGDTPLEGDLIINEGDEEP